MAGSNSERPKGGDETIAKSLRITYSLNEFGRNVGSKTRGFKSEMVESREGRTLSMKLAADDGNPKGTVWLAGRIGLGKEGKSSSNPLVKSKVFGQPRQGASGQEIDDGGGERGNLLLERNVFSVEAKNRKKIRSKEEERGKKQVHRGGEGRSSFAVFLQGRIAEAQSCEIITSKAAKEDEKGSYNIRRKSNVLGRIAKLKEKTTVSRRSE